jgi:Mn-dependent DtxR family transcriptional regulator
MRPLSLESDILESLMRKKEANAIEIAKELGVKTEKVVSTLKRLKTSGLIITS